MDSKLADAQLEAGPVRDSKVGVSANDGDSGTAPNQTPPEGDNPKPRNPKLRLGANPGAIIKIRR